MIDYYDEQLDVTRGKIVELEKNISIMQDNITELIEHTKAMQTFLIKLAHNQSEITRRVSQWPYIAVSTRGDEDA